jgi:hypothetical protein
MSILSNWFRKKNDESPRRHYFINIEEERERCEKVRAKQMKRINKGFRRMAIQRFLYNRSKTLYNLYVNRYYYLSFFLPLILWLYLIQIAISKGLYLWMDRMFGF